MAFNDERRMEEHVTPDRCQTRVMDPRHSTPARMVSVPDIDQAIETLSFKLGRAPVEIEVAEALHTTLADYGKALRGLEDSEGDGSRTNEDAEEEQRAMAEEMKHWASSEEWPRRCCAQDHRPLDHFRARHRACNPKTIREV
jgi:hypothetical protein